MKGVTVKKNLWPVIAANLRLAQKSYTAVGFPGDAPKTHETTEGGKTNLQVAVSNEYGSAPGVKPFVPPRPFIKETVRRAKAGRVGKLGHSLLSMVVRGKMSTQIALDRWGKAGADEMQATITDAKAWAVPNAAYTVAKKRSSTPLIDTGAMRQAVTYKTRMKGSR